jgi:hypothetical protein
MYWHNLVYSLNCHSLIYILNLEHLRHMQLLFFRLILPLHQWTKRHLSKLITNDTEEARNLGLLINDPKPSLENLPKEPDHSHPDLRRHTYPQMGFEKGRRKGIQHFLIIR